MTVLLPVDLSCIDECSWKPNKNVVLRLTLTIGHHVIRPRAIIGHTIIHVRLVFIVSTDVYNYDGMVSRMKY